jgi:hypothetical protein
MVLFVKKKEGTEDLVQARSAVSKHLVNKTIEVFSDTGADDPEFVYNAIFGDVLLREENVEYFE